MAMADTKISDNGMFNPFFFKEAERSNVHADKSAQRNMKMSSPFPDLIGESRKKELDSLVKPENDISGAE